MSIYAIHGHVIRCNEDRTIQIEDTSTGESYQVVEWNILGKLAKVIPFGSDEWQELFSASSVPKEWVAASIEENIRSLRESDISGKDEVISELESRLTKLV